MAEKEELVVLTIYDGSISREYALTIREAHKPTDMICQQTHAIDQRKYALGRDMPQMVCNYNAPHIPDDPLR